MTRDLGMQKSVPSPDHSFFRVYLGSSACETHGGTNQMPPEIGATPRARIPYSRAPLDAVNSPVAQHRSTLAPPDTSPVSIIYTLFDTNPRTHPLFNQGINSIYHLRIMPPI